ncbi:MAG: Flp family type IVb pilin [Planctomycetes bacterium]|nr:Flp family type IVb pilin [Planctomycetota bacterium]
MIPLRSGPTRKGASMTEYIIIVVLVAVALIIAVTMYGKTVEEKQMESDVTVDMELDAAPGNP